MTTINPAISFIAGYMFTIVAFWMLVHVWKIATTLWNNVTKARKRKYTERRIIGFITEMRQTNGSATITYITLAL